MCLSLSKLSSIAIYHESELRGYFRLISLLANSQFVLIRDYTEGARVFAGFMLLSSRKTTTQDDMGEWLQNATRIESLGVRFFWFNDRRSSIASAETQQTCVKNEAPKAA